ncbi:tRNA/rRNA methyltransferase [Deinococcus metalli]|uniref:tRNA (cytidine/uridine-2'-O-)-methyltransferase TrmJ n=1 Tax=Deinococcus metalli TaxID=1141878 RepID=A0A7W8KHK4_9DEIO|nr:RNA methyltransferase [Deinococcus metalli]MBB5377146.1 tRNA/rRNA methyltransferase [Deinococcus metalli]GHF48648.1 tRNA (cytidine/uridine-2'-O-)-methyltransferase TrmJ [Deinococcus metalli]
MNLAVVLVSPKTPGNIGAAARAMLNMGAGDLRLVAPRCNPLDPQAIAMAVHAEDLLRSARVYATLREALADRDLSVGTSARVRADLPPGRHPATLRPLVRAAAAPALVFGPEETGLINSDLEQCQVTVRIPTGDYASLNLAQAVLLVCYEFLQGVEDAPPPGEAPTTLPAPGRKTATREDMEAMYGHLRETMQLIGYTDAVRARHTLRLWRAMLDRALMSPAESRLFRGFLRQVHWRVEQAAKAVPDAQSES